MHFLKDDKNHSQDFHLNELRKGNLHSTVISALNFSDSMCFYGICLGTSSPEIDPVFQNISGVFQTKFHQ
jgi:hypothetical protein